MNIQSRLNRIEKLMKDVKKEKWRQKMLAYYQSEECKERGKFIRAQGEDFRKMFARLIKEEAKKRGLV